ncbi:alpha-L-fucosidase [candidate division KSB1 bacterium]|nr:alpha-L-fucosidase [candidate division KSB1 bacterium]
MQNHAIFLTIYLLIWSCVYARQKPAGFITSKKAASIEAWKKLRFGAFIHFNDNTFVENEISKNIDPKVFDPPVLDFDGMMNVFQKAGVKYAVLTARHTSGFCLWDSKATDFDIMNSAYPHDAVKLFVDACRKRGIKPGLYYCLWGNKDWNPAAWNPIIKNELIKSTPNEIIKKQLAELAENYGEIFEFWLDMQCWADSSVTTQELYDYLKVISPTSIVHFNQQVQDGTTIKYFPTDIVNGEERIPPASGHNPNRIINDTTYYLPFEYELTSQRCDHRSLGHGFMDGSVWFTYTDSYFYPVDRLYSYIKQNFDRGGSTILLSTALDKTGLYRTQDADSLIKLGKLILQQ